MKTIHKAVIFFLVLFLTLIACTSPAPTTVPADSPLSEPTAEAPIVSPLDSPLSNPEVPTPSVTSQITGPGFLLDRPILPGATQVSGQGPFGLQVLIVDMTMMGEPLGSTTIGDDGRFSVSLGEPAVENHVIGVQVVADRDFTEADIKQLLQMKGPGFKNYPRVGEAFDTVVVRQPE